jgi:hypothetical protein
MARILRKVASSPSRSGVGGAAPTGPAAGSSNLRILAAGIPRDERSLVEAAVRHALGPRAASEPWTVSLVKLAGKWSVTLNGPGERFRNLSFTAEETGLSAAIREILQAGRLGATPDVGAAAPVDATAPAGTAAAQARDEHTCPHCRQAVVVVYEAHPPEPKVPAPLACPHCWQVSRVDVGAWAAAGRDYRAEKA